jgi:hypothetical protein
MPTIPTTMARNAGTPRFAMTAMWIIFTTAISTGKPIPSVKKGFQSAVRLAGLPGRVTPHTLRHTAATWLMQRGVPIWEAAGFLGMSPEVLQDTYGHHHPRYLQGAAAAIGQKTQYVSVVESVVDLGPTNQQNKNSNDIWSEWQDLNLRPLRPERGLPNAANDLSGLIDAKNRKQGRNMPL